MRAFGGEASLRETLIARLQTATTEGRCSSDAEQPWDGAQESPIGCTVEGDVDDYARLVGIPVSVAMLVDGLSRYQSDAHPHLGRFPADLLRHLVPGQSTAALPHCIVLALFADLEPLGSSAAGTTVRDLHRQAAAGAPVAGWRAARNAAVAESDAAAPGTGEVMAEFAAAVAWPGTSRSLLVDALRTWRNVHQFTMMQASDWSWQQERAAHDILGGIVAEKQAAIDAGEDVNIPSIFRERHPAMEAGFVKNLHAQNAKFVNLTEQFAGIVLAAIDAGARAAR